MSNLLYGVLAVAGGLTTGYTLEWWRRQLSPPDLTREPMQPDTVQNAVLNAEFDAAHLASVSTRSGQQPVTYGVVTTFPEGGVG